MTYRYLLLLPFISFLLTGCNPAATESSPPKRVSSPDTTSKIGEEPSVVVQDDSPVVAEVGNETIRLKELDNTLALALFDLEWRKYELRKSMLSNMITHRQQLSGGALNAKLLLSPPQAPRIDLPRDKRPIKGSRDAPLILSVFCSYQSSHCARLQPVLKNLHAQYGASIGFSFYDLPQRFHRYGVEAANAVHCASEFGKQWPYMDALYSDITAFDKQRFLIIAEQLKLDKNKFEQCLDENRYMANVKADLQLASTLGLGNVPVIFINGLYTKGPKTVDAYRYYIDQELARLGGQTNAIAKQVPIESTLPISLMATTVSNDARHSTALIQLQGSDLGSTYKEGELLSDDIILVNIEQQRIIVNNTGRLEFIRLKSGTGSDVMGERSESYDQQANAALPSLNGAATQNRETAQREEPKIRQLPATGQMVLSKEWLQNELANQAELEAHFNNAEHAVEGHHLIKLSNIDDQRFYNTLGLKSGDVLMRVNEEWVHDGQNPLWDNLASEKSVSVVLMRKGHPVRYDYSIQ